MIPLDYDPIPEGWEKVKDTHQHVVWHKGDKSLRLQDFSMGNDVHQDWDLEMVDFSKNNGEILHRVFLLPDREYAISMARVLMLKE